MVVLSMPDMVSRVVQDTAGHGVDQVPTLITCAISMPVSCTMQFWIGWMVMSWMQMRRMLKMPMTRQIIVDGWKMNARNHVRWSCPASLSLKTCVNELTIHHAKGCCIWMLSVMREAWVICVLGRDPFLLMHLIVVASFSSRLVQTTWVAFESLLHCSQVMVQFQSTTRTMQAMRMPMQMFAMHTSS